MKSFTFSRALKAVIFYSCILLFACGCDKVTHAPDPYQTKLLLKEIYLSKNNNDTLYFSYDAKHRLTACNGYDLNGIFRNCRFEYDDNNRLVRAYNYNSGNGVLTYTFNYISADSIKLTLTSPAAPQDWMLVFNKKGQLIKTDIGYNLQEKGSPWVFYIGYDYDAAGNLSIADHHDNLAPERDTCIYDDKKSPFYNVVGRSPLLTLVLPDLLHSLPTTFAHNLVDMRDLNKTRTPGVYYGFKFIYQYDSDGFPTSVDFKASEDANYPIQYVYYKDL